jgi:DnaJ-domain-containing protein 1
MTDCFALFEEPRRPWIDPERLKQKFLAWSAELHPDRSHNATAAERQAAAERYAELNTAYNRIREPKDRLRHLLELETGTKPDDVQNVPAQLVEDAFEVARACREADAFLARKAAVASPLLQVQFFEPAQDWIARLNALQQQISLRQEDLVNELRGLNSAWDAGAPSNLPLGRLEEIRRQLGYFARWMEQLRERVVELSL